MAPLTVHLTEFAELISRYTADFYGRAWLDQQINELFEDPTCRIVVLTGTSGVGKTAFLAHLAAVHPRWLRYFIRRDSRELERPSDAATFLLTIGGQFATLYPKLFYPTNLQEVVQRIGQVDDNGQVVGVRINELINSPFYHVAVRVEQEIARVRGNVTAIEIGRLVTSPRSLQMQDLQALGLLDPAWRLNETEPEERLVVLVDALDELRFSLAEPDILRALSELPEIPPNLRFVVSSRPDPFLSRLLARHDVRELPLLVASQENLNDLRVYAEKVVNIKALSQSLVEFGQEPDMFLEELLAKAAGNFLYLKSVLRAILEALELPAHHNRLPLLLQVRELPDDLGALYASFLSVIVGSVARSGFGAAAWRTYLKPLLGSLAVAFQPLSEEQLAGFTQLEVEDVRHLLRELRQFVEPVGSPALHRIYHTSFAEYLLDRHRNKAYWIDARRAHARIADYYRADSQRWHEHHRYVSRYLSTHLFMAQRYTDLFDLVDDVPWYAKQSKVDPSGATYVNDLYQAWRAAEAEDEEAIRHGRVPPSFGREIQYALAIASVRNLSLNIPPSLLVALATSGVWTIDHALAAARQNPDRSVKCAALSALAKHLPDNERAAALREALDLAWTIQESHWRADALQGMAPHVPESLFDEMLDIAQQIDDESDFVRALDGLVPYLPVSVFLKTLRIVAELWRSAGEYRARALELLVPYLPTRYLGRAFEGARGIWHGEHRSRALAALAPRLPKKLLRSAFISAWSIDIPHYRKEALATLIPRLAEIHDPELLRNLAESVTGDTMEHQETEALGDLIAHLAEEQDSSGLHETLHRDWAMPDTWQHAVIRVTLVGRMPRPRSVIMLRGALAAIAAVERPDLRVRTLMALIPKLPSEMLPVALDVVRSRSGWEYLGGGGIGWEHITRALVKLIPRLPRPALDEVVTLVWPIEHRQYKGSVLAALIQRIGQPLSREFVRTVLTANARLTSRFQRAESLELLVSMLQPPLEQELLTATLDALWAIGYTEDRARIFSALAPHLDTVQLHDALASVQVIDDGEERTRASVGLTSYTPGQDGDQLIGTVFEKLQTTTYYASAWVETLEQLAINLPPPSLPKLLSHIHELQDPIRQIDVLAALAPRLPNESMAAAFAVAQNDRIKEDFIATQVRALAVLLPYLDEELRHHVLGFASSVMQGAAYDWQHAEVLAMLSPYLSETDYLPQLRSALRNTQIRDNITYLAPYLPDALLSDAVDSALATRQPYKMLALAALAPRLEQPQQSYVRGIVKGMILEYDDAFWKAKALSKLAPILTIAERQVLLGMVFERIQTVNDGSSREIAFRTLAPHLAQLPHADLYLQWQKALHALVFRSRRHLLRDIEALAPVLVALSGQHIGAEVARVLAVIGSRWP